MAGHKYCISASSNPGLLLFNHVRPWVTIRAWVIIQEWVITVSTPLGRQSTSMYLQVLDNTIHVKHW